MPQSFAALHCHVVFSTKHRRPQIKPEVRTRLFEFIGGILKNHSGRLIAAGGMPDHVHLLVSLARTMAVADAVRLVKSNSSGWMHDELRLPDFRWQDGYAAFAVSHSNLDEVKSYLANQEQHHRRMSFKEERQVSFAPVGLCESGGALRYQGLTPLAIDGSPRWG